MAPTPLFLYSLLKAFSLFAISVGTVDACLGISLLGVEPSFQYIAFADSQFRFLGTMFAGYGVMLWWASDDLWNRKVPLSILGGVMVAAGVARALSVWEYGFAVTPTWLVVAAAVEMVGPGGLYFWGRAIGVWSDMRV